MPSHITLRRLEPALLDQVHELERAALELRTAVQRVKLAGLRLLHQSEADRAPMTRRRLGLLVGAGAAAVACGEPFEVLCRCLPDDLRLDPAGHCHAFPVDEATSRCGRWTRATTTETASCISHCTACHGEEPA